MVRSRVAEVLTILEVHGSDYNQIVLYLTSIDPQRDQLETCLAFLNRTINMKIQLGESRSIFALKVFNRVIKARGLDEANHLFTDLF